MSIRIRKALCSVCTSVLVATGALADDVLRYQKDDARQREWILTSRGVVLVDAGITSVVELPGWSWAGEAYVCPPDLALGPEGEALVSSNVIASLWRIDPVSLRVTKHDLVLDAHVEKDVGFTGLRYAPALRSYFAVSEFGALWRIDPLLRRAQQIPLEPPLQRACGLTLARSDSRRGQRLPLLCVRAQGSQWSIRLAPDQRAAYAHHSCG